MREFLRRFFSQPVHAGQCVHGRLGDGPNLIDDPLVVLAEDESWADISLHGGAWVVAAALELARREGFTVLQDIGPPTPPEAMDEIGPVFQQEVIGHLPLARTDLALRRLLAQPTAWRQAMRDGFDVQTMLVDRSLWWLLHPPLVAIIGQANVGKSTLANQLFGQQRSITADVPGTTRDWVGELANIQGLAVMLVDTPGFGQAEDPLQQAALASSREKIAGSDLRILVLDATHPPAGPVELRDGLLVVNKTDQPAGWDFSRLAALPDLRPDWGRPGRAWAAHSRAFWRGR